jgi:vancomycin permeability regulator SanA
MVTVILLAALVSLAGYIALFGLHDSIEKADVIVIFGNTVNSDGSLSKRLRARMDRGIELFKEGKGDYVLVSGALGKEGVEESDAMKKYSIQNGVPEENILQDSRGVDTKATARNTAQLLGERKLDSVILVSQFFHLARADLAFQRAGIIRRGHAHARFFQLRDIYALFREVIAFPVYWIR